MELIEFEENGVKVIGEITYLSAFHIEVAIISPFQNWKDQSSITGHGRMVPNNFLVRYKSVGQILLSQTYSKLTNIDNNIDRFSRIYLSMLSEVEAVDANILGDIKKRIIYKLERHFFWETLHSTVHEEDRVRELFDVYLKEGRKIYLNKK